MTLCLGGIVNHEGVEIDARQYCGSRFFIDPDDLDARERVSVLNSLAGWRAEHSWHGRGERDRTQDDLECSIYEARAAVDGEWTLDEGGDDASAFIEMLRRTPDASDDVLIARYSDYSELCHRVISEPEVWCAIELLAVALVESGKLDSAHVIQAIGGSTYPLIAAARRHRDRRDRREAKNHG